MQWSRENWSPRSSAFYCLCWGNQPLLAVETSRGVCFSCCFSTQRTSLCDLLCPFEDTVSVRETGELGQATFLLQTPLPTCSGPPQLSTLLQQRQVAHHWVRTALCSWNVLILFALLFLIPFSLSFSLLTPTRFSGCCRSYCAICSPLSTCSSRAVVVLRGGGSSGSTGHQGAGKAVLSLSQPSRGASTVGARCWESLSGAMGLC